MGAQVISIAILDDDALFERVRSETENTGLFAGDGKGQKAQRIPFVEAPKQTLADILSGDRERRHIALSVGRRIVAVCGVQLNPHNREVLWVSHVGVEAAYRGNKFARKVIEAAFAYALERELFVEPSTYTEMGLLQVKPVFEELFGKYPQCAFFCDSL